jgi:hypothetical protein
MVGDVFSRFGERRKTRLPKKEQRLQACLSDCALGGVVGLVD